MITKLRLHRIIGMDSGVGQPAASATNTPSTLRAPIKGAQLPLFGQQSIGGLVRERTGVVNL